MTNPENGSGLQILDEKAPLRVLIARFLDISISQKHYTTVEHEARVLNLFSQFMGPVAIGAITQERAGAWRAFLSRFAPNTIRVRVQIVSGLCEFAVGIGALPSNPFERVPIPKVTFAGRAASDGELRKMMRHLPAMTRAACKLALYTGMRRGEILAVQPSWFRRGCIVIPADVAKSGKERSIRIKAPARRLLKFVPFQIAKTTLNRHIREAARKAGIPRLRFHDLRHTAATKAFEMRSDPLAVQQAFGWASSQASQPYQHLTPARNSLRIAYAI